MANNSPSRMTQERLALWDQGLDQIDDANTLRGLLHHLYIAIEQSPVATAITDTLGRILFVNQQFLDITGYEREELLGRTAAMIKSGQTPDAVYHQMWRALRRGEVWQGELMNRKKSGDLYWESEIITPVRNVQGEIVNYIAVKEDITERKRQESQLRLLATAFETGQATLITDAEMRIEKVNRAFTEITGYAAEEVLGLTPRLFKSGRHDKAFYAELWDTLLSTGHWQGEVWNKNKRGAIYPVWQSITAVHDEQGKVRNYVSVFHNITERKQIEQELEEQATLDHLTGTHNRRAFDRAIRQAIENCERRGGTFSLLIFDVDHFKSVNDRHGHDAGDDLLKALTGMVRQCLRQTDLLSRWGGEEFTILLSDTPISGAVQLAERIRQRVEKACFSGISITISVGLTQYRSGDGSDTMILRADDALYQAKRTGRNRVLASEAVRPSSPAECIGQLTQAPAAPANQ
ncbi:MAG: diguanylate cyclase [Halomonas sp.]|nr:diguanylate cyclase [Halomonas sp.]